MVLSRIDDDDPHPSPEDTQETTWRQTLGQTERGCYRSVSEGIISRAEIHWYEAHGVGKRRVKIKRFLD
jgi:hypothetical protein